MRIAKYKSSISNTDIEFITQLSQHTGYTIETCKKIYSILNRDFFISKNNRNKIIGDLMQNLNIDENSSNNIYIKAKEILSMTIKKEFFNGGK